MKFCISIPALFFTLLIPTIMQAQTLDGTFRMYGVHDMASGFLFTRDGHFEFFQMYGAIDRKAMGTYTLEGNTLKLHSNKKAGEDYKIISQSKKGKGITIKVVEPNDYLRKYVIAVVLVNGAQTGYSPDDKGMIHIEEGPLDTLALLHELYPDFATIIKDKDNPNTYFEVSLQPSLQEVSFKGIDFTVDGNEITCTPNYFLPYSNIRFEKE